MPQKRSLVALTVLASLSILGCSADATPPGTGEDVPAPPAEMRSASGIGGTTELQFRGDMDAAWTKVAHWTDLYVVDRMKDSTDTHEATLRMTAGEDAVAAVLQPLVGTEAGNELHELLRARGADVVAWVEATASGDSGGAAKADTAWAANGAALTAFFASFGVKTGVYSPSLLVQEQKATQALALAQANGDAQAIVDQASGAHKIAGTLAIQIEDALVARFASKIAPASPSDSFQLDLASDLAEAEFWTRMMGIEGAGVLPRVNDARAALGSFLGGFYGPAYASEIESQLRAVTADAYAFVVATPTKDPQQIVSAEKHWASDAIALAGSIAAKNHAIDAWKLIALVQDDATEQQDELGDLSGNEPTKDADAYDAALRTSRATAALIGAGLAKASPKRMP